MAKDGINRSISIPQPSIFGRIGTGIGKGLGEQIPKEIERNRLASGLKELNQQKGLSPQEYFTQALSVPGIIDRPQVLQSLEHLAALQNSRNALRNRQPRPGMARPGQEQPSPLQDVRYGNFPPERQPSQQQIQEGQPLQPGQEPNVPSNFPSRGIEAETGGGPIENPLQEKFQAIPAWTPERFDDQIQYHLDRDPTATLAQARERAAEDEQRYRSQPEGERKIQDDRIETQKKLDDEFDNQLATTLQKTGNEIYRDLTGTSLLNLKKQAFRDLSMNPDLNVKTAAEKWVKKGKDLADSKLIVSELANRDWWDKFSPSKKEEAIKRLQAAQKIFAETGNKNELYNILKTNNAPPRMDEKGNIIEAGRYGFGLSPGGAALIAYDRSPGIQKVIKESLNWKGYTPKGIAAQNTKFAENIANNLKAEDSLLAIAREMKDKNPRFNEAIFFDYFRQNPNLGLTPNMKKELQTGVSDIFPNWGDIALFPAFTRSVAND